MTRRKEGLQKGRKECKKEEGVQEGTKESRKERTSSPRSLLTLGMSAPDSERLPMSGWGAGESALRFSPLQKERRTNKKKKEGRKEGLTAGLA
jgi:hypothetical protein